MGFESLIFDMDGTLWDTQKPTAAAWNRAIATLNIDRQPITSDDIAGIMGLTTEDMRLKLFSNLPETVANDLLQQCFQNELEQIRMDGADFYPNVLDGLLKLSDSYDLYLVSNCEGPYLELFFEIAANRQLFKDVDCYGYSLVEKGKTISQLMQRNTVGKALYIGDTKHDEKASAAAGIPFAYMTYGFGSVDHPDYKFEAFSDLLSWLLPHK